MNNSPLYAYAHNRIIVNEAGIPVDFVFLEVNRTFENMTKLKAVDIINKHVLELIPNFDKWDFDWIGTYGKVALTGEAADFEVYSSNVKHWYRVHAFSTEKYYFTTELLDITHTKNAELRQKETEDKFEKAFRLSSSLMAISVEETGEYIDVNDAFAKATGYSRQEVIGKTSRELKIFEDIELRTKLIEEYKTKGEIRNVEVAIITKTGEKLHGLFSITQLMLNERSCLLTTMTDVTELKKSEQELRRSKKQLANALRMAKLGPWEYDVKTDTFTFNDYFYSMLRTDFEREGTYRMTSKQYAERFLYPDDIYFLANEIRNAIEAEHSEFSNFIEHRVIFPDAHVGYISVLYFIVKDENGKTIKTYGVNQDITERKQTEEAMKQAVNQAESANKAKSEFLANMSHELRTPLNAVIGFTDLLLRTSLDDAQKQYCESAHISGKNLLGIVNTILDFSKIEAGKLDLDIVETDIIELAHQTISSVKYQIEAKGLELKLSIETDLPRLAYFDPLRLKQILINLLANAAKFTQKGYVELKIIKTNINNGECTYRFSVTDTGIGMSDEVKQKIFKPFVQGDNSTTRRFGGTGLGLTISHMLAEKMNSTLHVRSEVNKGSEFYFELNTRLNSILYEKVN